MDRRTFLKSTAAGAGGLLIPAGLLSGCANQAPRTAPGEASGWDVVPEILSRIRPPQFANREFPITDYGAVQGTATSSTEAIARAIAACAEAGGGRVVVPAGEFLTGPIHLESNVNLHLADGATLRFSTNPDDYLPVVFSRWEGMELMNYSPLIYAFEKENVAITGSGTLDGQASNERWWSWKGKEEYGWSAGMPEQTPARDRLQVMVEEGVPVSERVFGAESYLRPSFIQPYRCQNVLVEGVTIINSPMWEVHPVLCTNVTVRGMTVVSHGPNNDGCNPESCRDVLIEDCHFDTGDDCIAIKSGRNADGRRIGVPSDGIIVRRCRMKDGHGGVVIGSELSGGVRNVFAEDCTMDSPHLDRALRIKTNSVRGGVVENVYMRNVQVGQVADAVFRVNFFYEEGDAGDFDPVVRNVEMQNVTCRQSRYGLYMRGYEYAPIRDVRLIDCRFENVAEGNVIEHVEDLTFESVYINDELV